MRPEQVKAREYFYQKGTALPPREIYDRVRVAFTATEEFLARVSEAEVRQRPAPGEWCVQEVVDHLVESHRPSLEELRCLLRGERPEDGPVPASLQSRAPMNRAWSELVGDLRRLHAEILGLLGGVAEELTLKAKAPIVMVVNVKNPDGSTSALQWIEDLDWKAYAAAIFRLHEIDHLKQAQRSLREVRSGAAEL
ncbi:MAG: DinB family protein [Candidatus Methylomirabilia bacterium]